MRRSRASISNIVEQLLAISRIGARPAAAFEPFDLVETVRTNVSDALLLAYRSNRQIDFIAPRARPCRSPIMARASRRRTAR
ncbi:MAG TPA: hypothetical protein VIG55_13290 [Methylosinus sp.]|jgi:hypothetical protein